MARVPLLNGLRRLFRDTRAARALGVPLEALPTRRQFIAGAAAAAASLPAVARAEKRGDPKIVIVGAGIAGLTCALTLRDKGYAATVYEAAGRVGGRMFSNTTHWAQGQVSEWGGELIDTGHRTIRTLAKRFDLPLDGVVAAQPRGSTDTYRFLQSYYPKSRVDDDFAPVYDAVTADLKAAGYPTSWNAHTPAGKALDLLSVHDWIETRVPGGHASPMGRLLDVAYAIEYGADTRQQAALNLIYLLAYQPRNNEFAAFGESDEAYHIRGGNERLPRAIADSLGEIRTGRRLDAVRTLPGGRTRLSFKGEEVDADWVVLALPFAVIRGVDTSKADFDARKRRAIDQLGRGLNGKTQLQFSTRLWNGTGPWPGVSNGSTFSDTGYQASWDVTRAQPGANGIQVFYSGGSVTAAMRSTTPFSTQSNPDAVADAVEALHRAEPVFPGLSAAWNGRTTQSLPHLSPFFKASYCFYKTGQYTDFGGHEGARQGGVLFCGEHTSTDYQGFMEGGASEGEKAGLALAKLIG